MCSKGTSPWVPVSVRRAPVQTAHARVRGSAHLCEIDRRARLELDGGGFMRSLWGNGEDRLHPSMLHVVLSPASICLFFLGFRPWDLGGFLFAILVSIFA